MVKLDIITSLFFFIFNDFTAISKAAVPLETAIPKSLPIYLDNFCSNSLTCLPSDEIQPSFIEFTINFIS